MKHWMAQYLGLAWTNTYDCFVHFTQVQADQFGITDIMDMVNVPRVSDHAAAQDFVNNDPQVTSRWSKVLTPREGDAVVFTRKAVSFHIGTWVAVDGGGVLHCARNDGVVFTPFRALNLLPFEHRKYLRHR